MIYLNEEKMKQISNLQIVFYFIKMWERDHQRIAEIIFQMYIYKLAI